jgi:hypothetical protein
MSDFACSFRNRVFPFSPHFSRPSTFLTYSHAGIFSVSARSNTVESVGFFFPRFKKLM